MRISLKVINSELERRDSQAVLAKGDGYFYFWGDHLRVGSSGREPLTYTFLGQ